MDGNVLRVISRYANSFDDIGEAKTRKRMTAWLDSILPEAAGDFNEALMELGALICNPQSPQCPICPICHGCQSHAAGTTGVVPVKAKKTAADHQKNGGWHRLAKRPPVFCPTPGVRPLIGHVVLSDYRNRGRQWPGYQKKARSLLPRAS